MKTNNMYITNKKNMNKGFTLLELLLVLALIAVIASCIMTFFITYVKANRMISANTDLQYSARKIASFISDKVMQSEGIVFLSDEANPDDNIIATTDPVNVKSISFSRVDTEFDSLVISGGKIYYKQTAENNKFDFIDNSNLLSENIKSIIISTQNSSDFQNAKYIELKISLSKDGEEYSITQVICLRNK